MQTDQKDVKDGGVRWRAGRGRWLASEMLIRNVSNKPRIDLDTLRGFSPLSGLDDDELTVIARTASLQALAKGTRLFSSGSNDEWAYYLVSGTLELRADDGPVLTLEAGSPGARNPVSNLRPRKYTVSALSAAEVLRVDNRLLEGLAPRDRGLPGYEVKEWIPLMDGESEDDEIPRLYREIVGDRPSLPSLPKLAWEIRRSMDDPDVDLAAVARLIETDPAIAARLVKVANSALYRLYSPVESCQEAVVRLGVDVARTLVISFAVRDLFKCADARFQERLEGLWRHSVEVAAISNVLAHLCVNFKPEKALLAGLLHDIGELAVLGYAARRSGGFDSLDTAMARLRGPVGAQLLRNWGFDEAFVAAAREAEDWFRDPGPEPDYCDLVIVAQIHSYLGKPGVATLPDIQAVPAFSKVAGGRLDPALSKSILGLSQDRIKRAQRLFSA